MHATIRTPAVAGLFYSDDPELLRADINHRLALAQQRLKASTQTLPTHYPKALIVPHAGYRFSGDAAAAAYALLLPYRRSIQRVVMLGPSHRVGFRGIALSHASQFQTPLGNIPIDLDAQQGLLDLPDLGYLEDAHQEEHCLEVQLPFLQCTLDHFSLVPLVVGDTNADQVAAILEHFWQDAATCILISSDLSHYHEYHTAQRIDHDTCLHIEAFEWQDLNSQHACGHNPLRGLMLWAQQHSLHIERLAYYNSGDSGGDHDRVVGYGAWALWPKA